MSNAKPYVYRCQHRITNQFYIGVRYANKVSAERDLGKKYFTSSDIIQPNFNDFDYEILSEYNNVSQACNAEQMFIFETINDPLSLNRHCDKLENCSKYQYRDITAHHRVSKKETIIEEPKTVWSTRWSSVPDIYRRYGSKR
jgi:hypothetical protein